MHQANVTPDRRGIEHISGGQITIHACGEGFPAGIVANTQDVIGPFLAETGLDYFLDSILFDSMRPGQEPPCAGNVGLGGIKRTGLAQFGKEAVKMQLCILC